MPSVAQQRYALHALRATPRILLACTFWHTPLLAHTVLTHGHALCRRTSCWRTGTHSAGTHSAACSPVSLGESDSIARRRGILKVWRRGILKVPELRMSYKAYANVRLHTAHTSLLCCSGLLKCRCTAGFGPGLREGVCGRRPCLSCAIFIYGRNTRTASQRFK